MNFKPELAHPNILSSIKLIRLVRSYPVLYVEGYTDKNKKDAAWVQIYQEFFPDYLSSSDYQKKAIGSSVRRRWKTLRDSIAREVKKNATVENYIRKKESPIIAELEFLIPHIKSSHCARLAEELGLRDTANYSYETEDPEDEESSRLIDLTEDYDIKPDIKMDASYEAFGNSVDESTDIYLADALIPAVQMNVSDAIFKESTNKDLDQSQNTVSSNINTTISSPVICSNPTSSQSVLNSWNTEYCAVAQYKEGEFMNSTVLCPSPINEEKHVDDNKTSVQQKKRPRLEHEESTELQAKILQLLTNLERREMNEQRAEKDNQDEDRMFLLSLVSDIKRVPPSKKMLIKAEIVTAIARAIP
ncbi:uncharacterized protein LOC119662717 isoform X2 [Teleopsis dalmanni]|uniref:uncharacterized protein LOC119662707 isoform X2 n=1 Tax=Teleopsis dalmanni TaxID=139649 RepID=UPI0018CEB340|nr:uncharacterized protein LOC119662707 isoform X2 [Teleopsis dalmanni]XP_037928354.1 uncharacterized protein LOC119662717 isoform X2 [Teleopsis dalmanni]